LLKTSSRLTSGQKIFFAELVGTYVVVLCATGSVVIDARLGGVLGLPFVAFAPFAGIAAMVYAFGKISMAHFNPAVTIGFLASGHIKKSQLPVYFGAEIIGALLASLSVLFFIGSEANLGANAPNYSFPLPLIFGVEVLVTGFLMAVIFAVVYTKGLRGWSGIAIGGMVGLDIFFFSFISGASMNPARSLAPALLSGALADLWLYWSATFVGSAAVALVCRKKFKS
jgi:glycerol uptake facilitator-like aquaporin